ncbi:MAG TPA: hypothetical protein DIT15_09695 [Arthrobacter bacterium]|jgi:hypothetical protein|nr:hypothetical protein [Arthrobacter sp.]HBH58535.1 hypothetical protein [Arthrobacter sp.]HCB58764.1 hypothetical protein [Arthrobacter sp.]HCC40156.1 hypothetical protein [Arthrobacter sp.]HCN22500.1 hypothetical protein [Arthrobacter sp.]
MPTLANQLVQFLMSLFNNPAAAQEFLNDPERALEGAGLRHVGSMDVDAVMPVVLDYAPITVPASSFSREDNTGGNTPWIGGATGNTAAPAGTTQLDDHAHAVQQLAHVVNNYSYTPVVDGRDTITDQSVHENIWAGDDVNQWFQNEVVIASGDHALASGDDLNVRDSHNTTDSYNTDNSLDASTDNSISAGGDRAIGTSQLDAADSFNTDVDFDVDDSLNDNSDNPVDNSDHSTTDVAVAIDHSFTDDHTFTDDHPTATDIGIADSFQDNPDNSDHLANPTNTDVALDLADSFIDNSQTEGSDAAIADSFNPVEAEDSYQDGLDNQDSVDNSANADPDVHTALPVDESHIVL